MAYKSYILTPCTDCSSGATYTVFNRKNSPVGNYCKRHADKKVRDLTRSEEAEDAARDAARTVRTRDLL